jgi:hypothetical protein
MNTGNTTSDSTVSRHSRASIAPSVVTNTTNNHCPISEATARAITYEIAVTASDETCDGNTVTGMYSLKYLNIFTKATGMCSTVQILQEQENRFLVLKYNFVLIYLFC